MRLSRELVRYNTDPSHNLRFCPPIFPLLRATPSTTFARYLRCLAGSSLRQISEGLGVIEVATLKLGTPRNVALPDFANNPTPILDVVKEESRNSAAMN